MNLRKFIKLPGKVGKKLKVLDMKVDSYQHSEAKKCGIFS
jgi:hypothetical protein